MAVGGAHLPTSRTVGHGRDWNYAGIIGCSSIPSLPYYLLCSGVANVLNPLVKLVCRPDHPSNKSRHGMRVLAFVGLLPIVFAIWGAVLTFGNTSMFTRSPSCPKQVFITGFVSSALPLFIFIILIVYGLLRLIIAKCRSHAERE